MWKRAYFLFYTLISLNQLEERYEPTKVGQEGYVAYIFDCMVITQWYERCEFVVLWPILVGGIDLFSNLENMQ